MTTRNTLAALGPINWISSERREARNKEASCLEDFAFAARAEFEWLNDYMAGAFMFTENVDVVDMMKTPGGRLKGKTPRTTRRSYQQERAGNVFLVNKDSFLHETFLDPVTNLEISSSFEEHPLHNTALIESARPESTRSSQPPELVRDSELWSNSLEQASDAGHFETFVNTNENFEDKEHDHKEPSGRAASEARQPFYANSRHSFQSAQEAVVNKAFVTSESCPPFITTPATPSICKSAKRKTSSDSPEDDGAVKTRRSSRVAQNSERRMPQNMPTSCPGLTSSDTFVAVPVATDIIILRPEDGSNASKSKDDPYATQAEKLIRSNHMSLDSPQAQQTPPSTTSGKVGDEPETPSEAPTPMPGIVRSSMNFASLPARETMTHKKSIGAGRPSRTSHLEGRLSRGTWSSGGKSLGNAHVSLELADENHTKDNEDERNLRHSPASNDDDDDLYTQLRLAEMNKKTVYRIGEKTSTQRLNEKISQLSQQNSLRPSRSIPSSGYPGFSTISGDIIALERPISSRRTTSDPQGHLSIVHGSEDKVNSDEDDWIPSKSQFPRTTPMNRGGLFANVSSAHEDGTDSPIKRSNSPFKTFTYLPQPSTASSSFAHPQTAPVFGTSPTRLPKPVKSRSPIKEQPLAPICYPEFPRNETGRQTTTTTHDIFASAMAVAPSPYKSPFDSALNAVKSRQQNLFSKARQLLFSKNKLESPKAALQSPRMPLEKLESFLQSSPLSSLDEAVSEVPSVPINMQLIEIEQPLYPDLDSSVKEDSAIDTSRFMKLAEDIQPTKLSNGENGPSVGVENFSDSPFRFEAALSDCSKSADKENIFESSIHKSEEQCTKSNARKDIQSTRSLEMDERHPTEVSVNIASKGLEWNSPDPDLLNTGDIDDAEEELSQPSKLPKPTPSGTIPRLKPQLSASSVLQNSKDTKKPIRGPPPKISEVSNAKPKPGPTNIRLGTISQREMDQRKVQVVPTSSTLISALADTFGNPPTKETSSYTKNITTSGSQSLRAPKSIAALNAAAKAKKDHEEKDRKRMEIERRRLEINQKREEERRQALTNRSRKPLEKALEEEQKRKLHSSNRTAMMSNAKPLARTNTVSNLRKALEESANMDGYGKQSKAMPELKRQPKRLFNAEPEDQPSQQLSRLENVKPINIVQQPDAKRRKTEDKTETLEVIGPSSAPVPPVRQSNIRKENVIPAKPGIFSQVFTPAPTFNQLQTLNKNAGVSSLIKTALHQQTASKVTSTQQLPQVDAVKFSNDKIKFATTTPGQTKTQANSALSKPSPVYHNGDSIDLPDIQTDSEDDGDDNEFNVPLWAESPELRMALQNQLGIDPETVFGPMAPLSMEDIFRGRGDRTHARFRNRTSSANWTGQDRLTAAEIEADRVERQRMIENNGWTYQKP